MLKGLLSKRPNLTGVIALLALLLSGYTAIQNNRAADPRVQLALTVTPDAQSCPQFTVYATNESTRPITLLSPNLGPVTGNTALSGTGASVTIWGSMRPVGYRGKLIPGPVEWSFPRYIEPNGVAAYVLPISPNWMRSMLHGTIRASPLPVSIKDTGDNPKIWNAAVTPDPSLLPQLDGELVNCKKLQGIPLGG